MLMSPEAIVSVLVRLNILLEDKYKEHTQKFKKFKTLQMSLIIISSSISIVLFVLYHAPVLQMLFVLIGFNLLFFVGFKPKTHYSEGSVKQMMQKVVLLQVKLKKYMTGETVSFDGVKCCIDEGWTADKWGLHKDNERIDYAEFLYDTSIKGLYLQALRNKK
ncbi:hypothetical protein JHD50_06870 [Sulfurimonas sp. MAG313]|nr:hypothetical protein [Sulfurimonas sp. MAG313]MDF1881028.1 hypothetical protein [Sulfurimonas sp. MAG313]